MAKFCALALLGPLALCAATAQAQSAPGQFELLLQSTPRALRAGEPARLELSVRNAATQRPVSAFQQTHEELLHVYIVSEDLEYFSHRHAVGSSREPFHVEAVFPRPGLYRILAEFQPAGSEPQSILTSVVVSAAGAGSAEATSVAKPPAGAGATATLPLSLRTQLSPPIAGDKSLLFFSLPASSTLQKFHGDWGQLLAVSDDLIDVIRAEPFPEAPVGRGKPVQFNIYFPRPRQYRVWVEIQTDGVIHTERFDVQVKEL